jgi:diguanylate cyclase (GGDEF)-like protein/putative nucleotidyltransferase with HDIG domain
MRPVAEGESTDNGLPIRAAAYVTAVCCLAFACAAPFAGRIDGTRRDWMLFGALAVAASLAQMMVVFLPRNQSYHLTTVFLLPAVLLLPPGMVVLIALVAHLPEWVKERYPWYIQAFNASNYTIDLLAAWGAMRLTQHLRMDADAAWAVGALAAVATFVIVNHLLLAMILLLARGHSFRTSGLFTLESLSVETAVATVGVVLTALWLENAWLTPAAVVPLLLIHRSLAVPALEEEARIDSKTGLYNARHFADELREELARSIRLDRPFSLLMADLDLLREINNTYGHLAGDAVLCGVADVFKREARHYDVSARFGGEEFAVLLPDTDAEEALAVAERIRVRVERSTFDVETSATSVSCTLSIGVATFPGDAHDANALIHQADLAVYRAKRAGRNLVASASSAPIAVDEPLLLEPPAPRSLSAVAASELPLPRPDRDVPRPPRIRPERPVTLAGPRLFELQPLLALLVIVVATTGVAGGAIGFALGGSHAFVDLLAVSTLVAAGQVLALELDGGSVSVSAVGALAAAAMLGPRAALPLALVVIAVQWWSGRPQIHQLAYNLGSLSLASLAAAGIFEAAASLGGSNPLVIAATGAVAGGVYYLINTGLLAAAMGLEGHESAFALWRERFAWLAPHYATFGAVAGAMAIANRAIGLYGLFVFAIPLFLIRMTMASYLRHAQRSTTQLRNAAETIQAQNDSLEEINQLLRERSTAAMASLSATVDARDSYTAGHSRRVQRLALAMGRELRLDPEALEALGHAALFHDVGKLAVPDNVLLKPEQLTHEEWEIMRKHADEGARIIDHLGFLGDAIPAIRHHHERWDGSGYPAGLAGEDIPLGARIIHVADAIDSMLTNRVYRSGRPMQDALVEIRRGRGGQFCPTCVDAVEAVFATDEHHRAALLGDVSPVDESEAA